MIREAALRAAVVVAAISAGASSARAWPGPEIEGLVRDEQGKPARSADVVATLLATGDGRAALSDEKGRFRLPDLSPGLYRLEVYTAHGARVTARVVALEPGSRYFVTVQGRQIGALVPVGPHASGGLLGPAELLPVRTRDVAGLVEQLPGSAPTSGAPGPVTLLGAGPAELRVSLDGLDLSDPVSGTVPFGLPLALFADVAVAAPAGSLAVDDSYPAGAIRLVPHFGERPRQIRFVALGSAGPEGRTHTLADSTGRWGDWPGPSAMGELAASRWMPRFDARVSLAAAPRVENRTAARFEEGNSEKVTWRRWLVPVLGGAQLRSGHWSLGAHALASIGGEDRESLRHIVDAQEIVERDTNQAGVFFRASHSSDEIVMSLPVGVYRTAEVTRTFRDRIETEGLRIQVSPQVSAERRFAGLHVTTGVADLRVSTGKRSGPQPLHLLDMVANRTRGRIISAAVGGGDRYQPWSWLELDLGLRAETALGRGETDLEEVPYGSLRTDVLLLPRAGLRLIHPSSGSALVVGFGRYSWPLPLHPHMSTPGLADVSVTSAYDDVRTAGIELRRWGAFFSATAIERTARKIVEDGISPDTGTPVVGNFGGAERRYRGLLLQAVGGRTRYLVQAAYVLSALRGNYTGFVEPETGRFSPGTTAQFDLPTLIINREGYLPYDRRHSLRLSGHARWRRFGTDIAVSVATRADSGTPISALGNNGFAGPGQAYLVRRGSVDRTPWIAAADARVEAGWATGSGRRVLLVLEGFNLTNYRPVTARDEIYTVDTVTPTPGIGAEHLAATTTTTGRTATVSPHFLAPVRHAEPLLVRIGLGFEM